MKQEKVMPIMLGLVLIMLIIEFIYAILHQCSYETRVNEGNARWQQVEERIKNIEETCNCGRTG